MSFGFRCPNSTDPPKLLPKVNSKLIPKSTWMFISFPVNKIKMEALIPAYSEIFSWEPDSVEDKLYTKYRLVAKNDMIRTGKGYCF